MAGEAGGFVVGGGQICEDLGDELEGERVHGDGVECVNICVCSGLYNCVF